MQRSQSAAVLQRRRVQARSANADAIGFFNLLTGPALRDDGESVLPKHRERLLPPTETLAMFPAQSLSADGRCRQAVDDAAVKRWIAGMAWCSSNSAASGKARARLPQAMVETVARRTGMLIANGVAQGWLWRGRRVLLADGTTTTLPDTEAHQAAYPQPASQSNGLGFPSMRLVGWLCLASGALLDAAEGPCAGKGSDEQTLLRGLLDHLGEGDILLGDAYFPTYFLLCELLRRGVDGRFEQLRRAPAQHRFQPRRAPWRARPSDRLDQAEASAVDERSSRRAGPRSVAGACTLCRWHDPGDHLA
jgi:hypothetical protein